MKNIKIVVLFSLLLIFKFLPAQEDHWNISLATGDTIFNVLLLNLAGDSLLVASDIEIEWIRISLIDGMTKIKGKRVISGMGIGILAGGVVGAIIGYVAYKKPEESESEVEIIAAPVNQFGQAASTLGGALIGGAIGMLIGGVAGSLETGHEDFDLSQWSQKNKINWLRSNLSEIN